MSKTTDNLLAFSLLGSLAATAVTGIALYHMTGLRRGGDAQHQAGEEKYIRSTSNDSDYLKRNPTSFFHPEGPNIGPSSTENWLHREGDLPAKTDLLHKGHVKGGLLVLAMVGLPGRGKTYIARKVARYLRWINYRTRAFSLARYRIEQFGPRQAADFYDNANETNVTVRQDLLKSALDDMMHYLSRGGECVILDGTNFTKERRQLIRDRVAREDGHEILWVESSTDDVSIIDKHLKHLQDSSPDFLSAEDFEARVAHYREVYEPVEMEEGSYVKIFDAGKRIEIHQAQGFLPTKITSFLMNMHISLVRPVYITRHGESMFNVEDKIGGDPDLSPMGKQYAEELVKFVENCPDLPKESLCVWSSTMKRARQTSKSIKCARYVEWRALREIEVGIADGLTYAEVKEQFPQEYAAREKDKLRYRYPRGESYLDIINRLEPVIFEMERQKQPLLIVAHQAVLRCLYAYFLDLPNEEVPYLSIPLHCVIKLTPQAFGCSEKRFKLLDTNPDGQMKM